MKTHKFADIFPMMGDEQFQILKNDIKENGFDENNPIWIYEDKILDGRNRNKACKELKIKPVIKIYNGDSPLDFVIRLNLKRRHLTSSQCAVVAQEVMPMLEEEAKKRQQGGQGGVLLVEKIPQAKVRDNKSAVKAGKMFNVNEKYVRDIKKLKKDGKQKEIEAIKQGEKTITEVKRQIKEDKRETERKEDSKKIKKIKKPEELFKEVKFTTIVIDPPWDWGDEGDVNQLGRAKPDYATMSLEELKKIPIDNITKPDAHIYLWVTNRSLPKGFELLKEWGFRYITCLTWCKPSFGMGNYFRGSTEQILFGVKGSLSLKRKDVGTWFEANRGKDGHSSKPEEFYKLIESCSPGLYLDYFGRTKKDGWFTYGSSNES